MGPGAPPPLPPLVGPVADKKLKMNEDKTEVILIGTQSKIGKSYRFEFIDGLELPYPLCRKRKEPRRHPRLTIVF